MKIQSKTTKSPLAVALGLIAVMLTVLSSAAANGTGLQYQYNGLHQQVTITTPELELRVTTGGNVPHFMFWVPNASSAAGLVYHVQFYQLIEFNDTNGDDTYTPGTDSVVRPILGLGSVEWDFSGFLVEGDSSAPTAIHFNFTLVDVQGPGYDELFVQLRCHVNATTSHELKFDIVMSGWPWLYATTSLALRWDLMVQLPGVHTYQHAARYHYEHRVYSFDGAYFSYRHTANNGTDSVPVNCSIEEQPDRTRFYLVYPNFGDALLEHDPTIGLQDAVTTTPEGVIILIVVGAGALACGVIALAFLLRRRQGNAAA